MLKDIKPELRNKTDIGLSFEKNYPVNKDCVMKDFNANRRYFTLEFETEGANTPTKFYVRDSIREVYTRETVAEILSKCSDIVVRE